MRVKRRLVKDLNILPKSNPDSAELIDEIKKLDEIINQGTDKMLQDEWIKSCDNLNGIKDPIKYWSLFSKLTGSFKKKVYADIKLNNQTATNDQERAEHFATHMSNTCQPQVGPDFDQEHKNSVDDFVKNNDNVFKPLTFADLDENLDDPDEPEVEHESMKGTKELLEKITSKQIKKNIMKTQNKSPGGKIFVQHLKMGTEKLFEVLAVIFNSCLDLGYFPDKWKKSLITMILKPNKQSSSPSSYRPISLLPVLGKLFEKVMTARIALFMLDNNLINKYQCGFRKRKSTIHQLIRLAEHIFKRFNKKPSGRSVLIFIDAEKAFDTVWHNGLKKQLLDAKIPIKIIRWISSFLDNRYGCVKVNNCVSRIVPLYAGVPQGSIIAPLLYIFHIRGMPTEISEEIVTSFYADDTTYGASDSPHASRKVFVSSHLQRILLDLQKFCSLWRIKLNPEKTWCVNFFTNTKNDNTPRLWLKDELLQYKKVCKFLGVTLDQSLDFSDHIEDIVSRSKKRLNLLKALRGQTWGASPETILYSYRTFVRPILEYGCILFAHAKDSLLKKIQSIEVEAIKIAHRLPPWATNTWCYDLVSFPNVLNRIKDLSKKFVETNKDDELIKPLIENLKPFIGMLNLTVLTLGPNFFND